MGLEPPKFLGEKKKSKRKYDFDYFVIGKPYTYPLITLHRWWIWWLSNCENGCRSRIESRALRFCEGLSSRNYLGDRRNLC